MSETISSGSCRLCLQSRARTANPWDEALLESRHFRVLPSLGALVEGWLLLTPKAHVIASAMLADDVLTEMFKLKDLAARLVRDKYGQVRIFEHGPSAAQRSVGCGVDHAHLHIVPTEVDLLTAAAQFLPTDARWSAASLGDCRLASEQGLDYLYVEQPLGNGFAYTHPGIGSQVFRKAIAASIGRPEAYDWRRFPHFRNVFSTIRHVKQTLGKKEALLRVS
jgi:ATP adenylyltransferase